MKAKYKPTPLNQCVGRNVKLKFNYLFQRHQEILVTLILVSMMEAAFPMTAQTLGMFVNVTQISWETTVKPS